MIKSTIGLFAALASAVALADGAPLFLSAKPAVTPAQAQRYQAIATAKTASGVPAPISVLPVSLNAGAMAANVITADVDGKTLIFARSGGGDSKSWSGKTDGAMLTLSMVADGTVIGEIATADRGYNFYSVSGAYVLITQQRIAPPPFVDLTLEQRAALVPDEPRKTFPGVKP